MSLVLDSSVALASVMNLETTPAVVQAMGHVIEDGAWVPSLWRIEVANVLQMKVRYQNSDEAFRDLALADLGGLPISIDSETDRQAWGETLRLASLHRLTL
jgi:predicted nucleic acid-binding protein